MEKTDDGSIILSDLGWHEQKISISRLLQIIKDNNLDPKSSYIELSYSIGGPYNENPSLLITYDEFRKKSSSTCNKKIFDNDDDE